MTLNEWFRKMEEQEAPIFRRTALDVGDAATDPETGVESMGKLILNDPLLTTKVLKLANSAYYNPSGRPIQTIGRSLLLLGMEKIRAICLGVSLVETIRDGRRLHRVHRELARSLLAAVFARSLAEARQDGPVEEIFIAALLRRIGPLLFWNLGEEEADVLDGVLRESGDDPSTEKAVLGFQLASISLMASEEWKLSRLLSELLLGHLGKAVLPVLRGWEAAAFLIDGWDTQRARDGIGRLGSFIGQSGSQATTLAAGVLRDAREWAMQIGAEELLAYLPLPPEEGSELDSLYQEPESSTFVPATEAVRVPTLARTLREISEIVEVTDFHRIPGIVLDGLHRGLGMDRALFATFIPSTAEIRCRTAVGEEVSEFMDGWKFPLRLQMADSLSRSIERNSPFWFDPTSAERPPTLPPSLERFLRGYSFLFLPVHVQGRILGTFCADRGPSRRDLDPVTIQGFQMLAHELDQAILRVRPA
ncbi:MAG: HDOD domain-containing protein [Fibrobacteria bacterium]|nr:HDOD domain-containing protein [Fibrobacteria bacterium]